MSADDAGRAERLGARRRVRRRRRARRRARRLARCAARWRPATSSSWTLLGEYDGARARRTRFTPACRTARRICFAVRPDHAHAGRRIGSRSVGGVYGADRWHVRPRPRTRLRRSARSLRLRRDAEPGRARTLGMRARVVRPDDRRRARRSGWSRLARTSSCRRPTTGPWLPPERTFSPLRAGHAASSRARPSIAGRDSMQTFDANGEPSAFSVRRLHRVHARIRSSTLFGLDDRSAVRALLRRDARRCRRAGLDRRVAGHAAASRRPGASITSLANADWTHRSACRVPCAGVAPSAVRRGRRARLTT